MNTTFGSQHWISLTNPTVMTLGNFDGVHLGHQAIFQKLIGCGKKKYNNASSLVYTFEPHPVKLLSPETPFCLLQTRDQKLAAIADCHIDQVIIEPFTTEFAHLSAEDFFSTIICERIQPREIFVGYDFTFGSHRSGTAQMLKELGDRASIPVHIIEAQFLSETLLSSSLIRQRIQAGDIDAATRMLGRPYEIAGTIIQGKGLGKKIGFATANLSPLNECLPAPGIYVTRFLYDSSNEPSVTYVGYNPTLGKTSLAIETHVLVAVPELLGKHVSVHFISRIRAEKKFSSQEELRQAIVSDCQEALNYHAKAH